MWTFTQLLKFSLPFDVDCEEVRLWLQVKLIDIQLRFEVRVSGSTSLIFIWTTRFHLDNYLTLSLTPRKLWACLSFHLTVNSYSLTWSRAKVCCIGSCQIITCLMRFFCQHRLTPMLHLFAITNDIGCLINKLWLLLCEFSCFLFLLLLFLCVCVPTKWAGYDTRSIF